MAAGVGADLAHMEAQFCGLVGVEGCRSSFVENGDFVGRFYDSAIVRFSAVYARFVTRTLFVQYARWFSVLFAWMSSTVVFPWSRIDGNFQSYMVAKVHFEIHTFYNKLIMVDI